MCPWVRERSSTRLVSPSGGSPGDLAVIRLRGEKLVVVGDHGLRNAVGFEVARLNVSGRMFDVEEAEISDVVASLPSCGSPWRFRSGSSDCRGNSLRRQ